MCQQKCSPRRCFNTFQRILSRFRALTARIMFGMFSVIAIASLAHQKSDPKYYLLIFTILPMLGETIITFNNYSRRKSAGKWFSPVVFLFLCSACPSIWIMRLHLAINIIPQKRNISDGANQSPMINLEDEDGYITYSSQGMQDSYSASFILQGSPMRRCQILEQLLLLVLIVGRWFLPRAGISRDQLSQLLLVNIGMAADIIELFEAFREDTVRKSVMLTVIILGIWQASLIQFSLTKTATRSRRPATTTKTRILTGNCLFCETDLWAISISLTLQDVPFLSLRLVLIFFYNIVSYSNVFFTLKNTLVIILQLFRFAVILIEHSYRKSLTESPTGTEGGRHTFSFMFEHQKSHSLSRPSSAHMIASDHSTLNVNKDTFRNVNQQNRSSISRRLMKLFSNRRRATEPAPEPKIILRTPSPMPPVIYKPPKWRKRRRSPAGAAKMAALRRIHPPEVPTVSFIPKRRSSSQALWMSRRGLRSLSPGRPIIQQEAGARSWHIGDDSDSLIDLDIDTHRAELIDDRGFYTNFA